MRWIAVALLLLTGAACAAPDEKPPETLDLVHSLERLANGKPLPVIALEDRFTKMPKPPVPGNPDGLLATLQDLGDAFSSAPPPEGATGAFLLSAQRRRTVYQPFAFDTARGRLWTVANSRMWSPSSDAPPSPPLGRLEAGEVLFRTLDAGQLKKAGDGLRWQDLTPVQQEAMRALIGGPWAVTISEQDKDWNWTRRYLSVSDQPLPLEKCVLRLSIGFDGVFVVAGPPEGDVVPFYPFRADVPELAVRPDAYDWILRVRPQAPHALKPSDLDYGTPSLRKPLGVQGVSTLGKVVSAAAALSGLPLQVDARWKDRPIFVGDGATEAGDVLRAAAFAVDGAWRKVGEVYLFTWDRQGLASVNVPKAMAGAAEEAAEMRARQAASRQPRPDFARDALSLLPADPWMPVKPNAEQIAAMFAPLADDVQPDDAWRARESRTNGIFGWKNLDGDQQAALRDAAAAGTIRPDRDQPFRAAMLPDARFDTPTLHVTLEIPGVSAVDATNALAALLVDLSGRDEVFGAFMKRRGEEDRRKETARLEKPVVLKQPVRTVAPPPLPPGEWPRLVDQMRRKGLNTLYVPVLWDGMTLFPSANFPTAPICDGRDALADILALARKSGIRVVAVVQVLAWRLPGSAVHWLDRHPELVDTNAAGQGRRAWAAAIPDPLSRFMLTYRAGDVQLKDAAVFADYVRPDGLLAELRRYKGFSGVALADWTRLTGTDPASESWTWGEAGPPLGYDLASRAAFLKANGVDPLDIDPFAIRVRWLNDLAAGEYLGKWADFRFAQDAALTTALLAGIEKGWPGQAQLISFTKPTPARAVPAADIIVSWEASTARGRKAAYRHVTWPATALPDESTGALPEDGDEVRRRGFRLDLQNAAGDAAGTGIFKTDGVVLDFTAAPDMLWDGLKLLPDVRR